MSGKNRPSPNLPVKDKKGKVAVKRERDGRQLHRPSILRKYWTGHLQLMNLISVNQQLTYTSTLNRHKFKIVSAIQSLKNGKALDMTTKMQNYSKQILYLQPQFYSQSFKTSWKEKPYQMNGIMESSLKYKKRQPEWLQQLARNSTAFHP